MQERGRKVWITCRFCAEHFPIYKKGVRFFTIRKEGGIEDVTDDERIQKVLNIMRKEAPMWR